MLFCGISSRRSSSAQQWRRSAAKFSATVQLHRNISEVGDFSKYFGNYWKAPVASRKKTPESQDVTRLYSIQSQTKAQNTTKYFISTRQLCWYCCQIHVELLACLFTRVRCRCTQSVKTTHATSIIRAKRSELSNIRFFFILRAFFQKSQIFELQL